MSSVTVRFPPSPTGYCHVGTARMAIVNYLFAKRHGGTIVFRSEDTDRERSTLEFEEDIKDQLTWLGLSWDTFYRQSERADIHTKALQSLVEKNLAYISEEPSKKDENTLVRVVRLRNPGSVITFHDEIRGDISFDTTELGDFVIARSPTDPLYHFAVVMDDHDMGVTHVIRGEDHISNTPRQILIQQALGYSRPIYAHYPLHLGADKSKLSKRTGDVSVRSYREKGFLPEALLNYIALLGWTPPSDREILGLEEMIVQFDLKDLHKSGAVFDIEKLRWYNREYLIRTPESDFTEHALQYLKAALSERSISWDRDIAAKLAPTIRDRISVWGDITDQCTEGEYDYFFADPQVDVALLPQKGDPHELTKQYLQHVETVLSETESETFDDPIRLKEVLWEYATEKGRGSVLWPLRYALSGMKKSPDPFEISYIIGKESTLRRVRAAIALL